LGHGRAYTIHRAKRTALIGTQSAIYILKDPHEPDLVDYLAAASAASAASEIGFHNSDYTGCIRQHHTSGKGQEKRKSQETNKIKTSRVNLDVYKTKEPSKN